MKLFTQVFDQNILQTDLEEKQKNTVKETLEDDEVFFLGTQPEHSRDRFGRNAKDKLKK